MLTKIRKLIYKLGLKPKPGGIFFSPTLHYTLASREAMKVFKESSWPIPVIPFPEFENDEKISDN